DARRARGASRRAKLASGNKRLAERGLAAREPRRAKSRLPQRWLKVRSTFCQERNTAKTLAAYRKVLRHAVLASGDNLTGLVAAQVTLAAPPGGELAGWLRRRTPQGLRRRGPTQTPAREGREDRGPSVGAPLLQPTSARATSEC